MAKPFGRSSPQGFVGFGIYGIPEVINNLNRQIGGMGTRSKAAMGHVGLEVKAAAMKHTPVATGNLRNSAYSEVISQRTSGGYSSGGWESGVEVGYTAKYAVYVHEIPANHPVGDWKFLERGLRESVAKILEILRVGISIRGPA